MSSSSAGRMRSAFLRIVIIAAIASPLIIRSLAARQNFDDACYIQFAAAVARGEMPYRDFTLTQLPAVELFLGAIYRVTGPSLPLTAGITACLIWGIAILIWRIGVRLGGQSVGVIAALLWAWAPPVIAHHFFEREYFTTIIMLGMLNLETGSGKQDGHVPSVPPPGSRPLLKAEEGQATDSVVSGRIRLAILIALSTLGLLAKFTFIFAIAGFALSMALECREQPQDDPVHDLPVRRALVYLVGCALSAAIALGFLVKIMSTELIWQAFLFQSMKGSTPLVERLSVFSKAVGPWAVLAIAGSIATADRKLCGLTFRQWRLVAILAFVMSVPFVLLGPTYWSHNTIDPVALFALLGAVGLRTAWDGRSPLWRHRGNHMVSHTYFARGAAVAATVMLLSLIVRGHLEFVTEGISKEELLRVSAEISRLTGPQDDREPDHPAAHGESIIAPSAVLIFANRPTPIVHPEYLGVCRWIKESVAEHGLWKTWREASRRGFYENRRMEKWRWEEDAYREIAQGRVRVVVLENPPFNAPEDSLDPARLLATGLSPGAATERYRVWSK